MNWTPKGTRLRFPGISRTMEWTRDTGGRNRGSLCTSLWVLLVREAPEVPTIMQTVAIVLSCPQELTGETLLLKTSHTHSCKEWRNQAVTELEAFSLPASFHASTYYVGHQGRSHQQSYPGMKSVSDNKNLSGKVCPLSQ